MGLLKPLLTWLTGNKRLLFSYAMVASIIVIGSVVINLWGKNLVLQNRILESDGKIATLSYNVDTYRKIVDAQKHELSVLRAVQNADREYAKGLESDNATLKSQHDKLERKVEQLKRGNKEVADFFNTPIPDALRGL